MTKKRIKIDSVWQILKVVIINFVILLFLLILIDPIFKTKENKSFAVSRYILLKEIYPNHDRYYMPSARYMEYVENLEQKPYRLRTNKNGFITGPNTSIENTDSVDLIFFGGSTVECLYVDEDLRYPYLVGELLVDKTTGMNLISLNGGVSGNHSLHSTLNLLTKGVNLHPKIVIFMHNINDLSLLTNTGTYWIAPKTRSIIQIQETVKEKKSILLLKSTADLFIPNISRKLLRRLKQVTQDEVDEWEGFRQTDIHVYEYETIEKAYEQAVNSFVAISRSFNMDVILMTQFNRINQEDLFVKNYFESMGIDFYSFTQYYNRFNNKIREIAEREDLLLIDLARLMPSDRRYIFDAIHLNNQGSELVADIIAIELEKYYPDIIKIK